MESVQSERINVMKFGIVKSKPKLHTCIFNFRLTLLHILVVQGFCKPNSQICNAGSILLMQLLLHNEVFSFTFELINNIVLSLQEHIQGRVIQ